VQRSATDAESTIATEAHAWADPAEVHSLFVRAGETAGVTARDYTLAGAPVRVRFAGSAMLDRVAPSIAHLERPGSGPAALTLNVWDTASTGTAAPEFPEVDASPDGVRARYFVERAGVRAAYQPGNGMLSILDSTRSEAWYWADDAEALPFLDAAEPMRQIFHWWLGDRGLLMLHGGAVGSAGGGVLITGKNGSGKSTAALASLSSHLRYAGDDYVVVRPGTPPRLYSLYNSGKLERHHLVRFREVLTKLPPANAVPQDEKCVVFVNELYPGRVIADFPLRAVVVPRVTSGRTARLLELAPAGALAALAPTTLLQHFPPQPAALASMAALVRSVPTFTLELGSDLASIPDVIGAFLESVR
jgi:hypothetical protein